MSILLNVLMLKTLGWQRMGGHGLLLILTHGVTHYVDGVEKVYVGDKKSYVRVFELQRIRGPLAILGGFKRRYRSALVSMAAAAKKGDKRTFMEGRTLSGGKNDRHAEDL